MMRLAVILTPVRVRDRTQGASPHESIHTFKGGERYHTSLSKV
jgi:hypothetical protein